MPRQLVVRQTFSPEVNLEITFREGSTGLRRLVQAEYQRAETAGCARRRADYFFQRAALSSVPNHLATFPLSFIVKRCIQSVSWTGPSGRALPLVLPIEVQWLGPSKNSLGSNSRIFAV